MLLRSLPWLTFAFAAAAFAESMPQSVDSAAIERFEQAVERARQNPAAAIETFEALIQAHPRWPEPYNNLAVLYAERGEEKKAEQALLAAMGTHPSYALVHKNLEALYAGMARRAYRKALKDDSAGPAPPKLQLADRVGAETLIAARATTLAASREASFESGPEPAVEVAAAGPASVEPEVDGSEAADEARRAVLATVASWLEAWSSQDVERYLSFYGHHFTPGKGRSRERWAAIRRERVAGPDFIEIDIQDPSVTFEAADRASVKFRQFYRSNTFEGQTMKTLRLSRGSEGWKIISEETGG